MKDGELINLIEAKVSRKLQPDGYVTYSCGPVELDLRDDGQACLSAFGVSGNIRPKDLYHALPMLLVAMHPEVLAWLEHFGKGA